MVFESQEEQLVNAAIEKYDRGDYRGAIRDDTRAIALRPGDGRPYRDRGLAKEEMGDLAGALSDLDTAVALRGWDHELRRIKAEAEIKVLNAMQEAALDTATPDGRTLSVQLVVARLRLIGVLDTIIRVNQSNEEEDPLAYGDRGRLRFDAGDAQGAIEDFSRVLSLDYESVWAYYDRGLAEAALGEFATAIRDFSTILATDELDGPAYYQRGLARKSSGDPAGGCADLRRAVELGVEGSDSALEEMCK